MRSAKGLKKPSSAAAQTSRLLLSITVETLELNSDLAPKKVDGSMNS